MPFNERKKSLCRQIGLIDCSASYWAGAARLQTETLGHGKQQVTGTE